MATKKRTLKKLILVGDSGIGKTSLGNMYVNNKFSMQYKSTIGADFLSKEIDINGTTATLQIWDTAGRERFQSLGVAFYRGADGVFLLYDITNSKSFENVNSWREEIFVQTGSQDLKMILIGLKLDLEAKRTVSTKRAQSLADCWGIPFVEVSSKDNIGVDDAVRKLVDLIGHEPEEVVTPKPIDLKSESASFWDSLLNWFASFFHPAKVEPSSLKVASGH